MLTAREVYTTRRRHTNTSFPESFSLRHNDLPTTTTTTTTTRSLVTQTQITEVPETTASKTSHQTHAHPGTQKHIRNPACPIPPPRHDRRRKRKKRCCGKSRYPRSFTPTHRGSVVCSVRRGLRVWMRSVATLRRRVHLALLLPPPL